MVQNTTPKQPKGTQDHNNQKKQQEYGDKKHQDHNDKEKHESSHSLFLIFLVEMSSSTRANTHDVPQ
jgi:hypothetical protein